MSKARTTSRADAPASAMIDERFYRRLGPVAAKDLALGAEIVGDPERTVTGVAALGGAGLDDLAYADGKKPFETEASVVITTAAASEAYSGGATRIVVKEPRAHFSRVASKIVALREWGAQAQAVCADAVIEDGAVLGPGVVVGAAARIGAGAVLAPNAVIGPGVTIGRNCRIGANAVIVCALVGDGVSVYPGASIGQAGFGVAGDALGAVDVPHFGRVIIQDGATIGANATVDRGVFEDTVLAENVKTDNLCHVGHNVTLGRNALMAAFAGISGSVTVGDGVIIGGRVGIADHRSIGRGAVLAGGSGIMHDVPAGETWAGYPARPIRRWLREVAWLARETGKRDGGSS